MITAEKIDFFKESVNATYAGVPSAMVHTADPHQMDFMKTLEKSTANESFQVTTTTEKYRGDTTPTTDNTHLKKNDERLERDKTQEHKENANPNKPNEDTEKKGDTGQSQGKSSGKTGRSGTKKQPGQHFPGPKRGGQGQKRRSHRRTGHSSQRNPQTTPRANPTHRRYQGGYERQLLRDQSPHPHQRG